MSSAASADVVVVGAGAAGLWAAARAAAGGASVLVLEKTPRTGTKVLASGGTRCNLTTTLGPDDAARLFGPRGERFLRPAMRALPPLAVRAWFAERGVPTHEEPLEKVFPASGRARDVRDALERAAREAGARIRCDAGALGLAREPGGGWRVALAGGEAVAAPRVVLAAGGTSYPRTGTTGDAYAWLRALDLPLVEPVPALVPLASDAPWVRELTGIALANVEARLVAGERVVGRRRRPVLFTHQGVSGPGAMDLSEHVARGAGERFALLVDLAPDLAWEELRALLVDAAAAPGGPRVRHVLPFDLPRRVLARVAAQALLDDPDPRARALDKAARHRLIAALKGLRVPVSGTLGFDRAEVTAGGLDVAAVDPRTMRVRGCAGRWVCGELLDGAGPIGGLNFQSAFATAELAGRDVARC